MHYPDLVPWEFSQARISVLMVGWLQPDHEFTKGRVPADVFRKLVPLLKNPWNPHPSAGLHPCEFCYFTGGPASVTFEQTTAVIGSNIVFIPDDGRVYLAPSTILHYIDAHGYCPPADFQQAVLKCPPMRSVAYLKMVAKAGLTGIPQGPAREVKPGE